MVNFQDPAVIIQDYIVVTKLWHTMAGLYIWEFVTNLYYEWDIIRGRLPYRWTIWVYSLARVGALLAVILGFVQMDSNGPLNCQVILSLIVVFSFLATSASSLLIVLRVIAIWNRNKVATAAAFGVWVFNIAFLIQGVVRLHSEWAPAQQTCISPNSDSSLLNIVSMLVTDIALLLIVLGGLFHLRCQEGGMFGLSKFLWKQGVIWLLLATVAGVPPVVFISLNLNVPFNIMFQPPSWITMTIAATRMHRSLVDFASGSTDIFSTPQNLLQNNSSLQTTELKWSNTTATSIPMDRMEVTMHVVSEQHGAPRMKDDDSSINANEHMHKKLNGLHRDDDVDVGCNV